LKHKVLLTDTLKGVAIKYNITPATLKKTNKIFGPDDEIHLKDYLLIPRDPTSFGELAKLEGPTNNDILQLFKTENKITIEEARFYLTDADWDVDKARLELAKDREFEKKHYKKNNPYYSNKSD